MRYLKLAGAPVFFVMAALNYSSHNYFCGNGSVLGSMWFMYLLMGVSCLSYWLEGKK